MTVKKCPNKTVKGFRWNLCQERLEHSITPIIPILKRSYQKLHYDICILDSSEMSDSDTVVNNSW